MAMRRFMAVGRIWLWGALLVVGVGSSGCFCFSQQPPGGALVDEPPAPVAKKNIYDELALPPAKPAPVAAVEPREPPPAIPVAVVPPAVVAAIEDLGQKYPGLFTFDKEKGLFRFNADITFDSGSSVVKAGPKAALEKLALILNGDQVRDRRLTILGYTDNDPVKKAGTIARLRALGKPTDNMGLSEARAEAVAEILKNGGIDAGRIVTEGNGQANPIADNRSAAGKAQNRRVEIYLTPMR
jgi:outer membrane protein OmpA-like peptidoglycan-associated protein